MNLTKDLCILIVYSTKKSNNYLEYIANKIDVVGPDIYSNLVLCIGTCIKSERSVKVSVYN